MLEAFRFFPSAGFLCHPIIYTFTALIITLAGIYSHFWIYHEWSLSYKNLPGPKPSQWLMGNIGDIGKLEPGQQHELWSKEFGLAFRYHMLFGNHRVCFADPAALNYILSHHDQLPKPALTRRFVIDLAGNGVLVAEGLDHRRQRRVLNPSFSPQSIRDVLPIFYDKAMELREKLLGLIEEDSEGTAAPTPTKKEDLVTGGRKIDVMKYLGMVTIDIIGLAGFNYDFTALSQPSNELANAFTNLFQAAQNFTGMDIIQTFVPGMSRLPTKRTATMKASQKVTQRIGRRLIEEKKWALQQAHSDGIEQGDDIGKDILATCIKANLAADLRPENRLSDDEVLAQITTFMLAGYETSGTALTWILYLLAQNPEAQSRLRKECLEVSDDRPSLEDISAMPYLNGVVHEGLRLLSPVPSTDREANQDVVIPLGTPVKSRNGEMMDHVKISKGTGIFIPISLFNTSEAIWGPNAKSFDPLRHISVSEGGTADEKLRDTQNSVSGAWGGIITFLGGTRNCIGFRFALAEIKVILFVLIRGLEFEELASKPKIEKKNAIVMRPRVVGEESAGLQMPLMLKPLAQT